IADAAGGAALDTGGRDDVRRTVVADAVAGLGRIAGAGGGTALRRALGIGRTGGAEAGAGLGHVADTGRRATRGRGRCEQVGRAARRESGAVLGRVADVGRRAAFGGG